MKVTVSAPGKIILCGEHSVVHGKKAIAVALDMRTKLSIETSSSNYIDYKSENLNLSERFCLDKLIIDKQFNFKEENFSELILSIRKFLTSDYQLSESQTSAVVSFLFLYLTCCKTKNWPLFGLKVTITSSLPIGAGLGSSSSYSVCVAAGLLRVFQLSEHSSAQSSFSKAQVEEICQWAYQLETIFHGKPSGIDNTICSYGHATIFQSGQKTLPSKINKINIIVVNTKIPRNTKLLVQRVSDLLANFPSVIEPIFESMDAIASQFEKSLIGKVNYEELKKLVQINQQLLRAIGVSHISLDDICRICSKHDLSGKLTGAGGGGCAYVLLPPAISDERLFRIKDELESNGYSCMLSSVGGKGVSLDFFEE